MTSVSWKLVPRNEVMKVVVVVSLFLAINTIMSTTAAGEPSPTTRGEETFNLLNQSHREVSHQMNNTTLQLIEQITTTAAPREDASVAIVAFWPWQLILISVYTLTSVLTLALNAMTIWVLAHYGRTISAELWKFLVSLAVADISMSLFCIPFTYTNVLLQQWIFYDFLCPLVNFAQCCSIFVSVWTLTVIGIERYFAIVHPLHLLNWLHSHKGFMIAAIWALGLLFALPQLFISKMSPYEKYDRVWHECTEVWSNPAHGQMFTIVVFAVTFGAPVAILFFVYLSILRNIQNNVTPGNPDSIRDRRQNNRKRKVTKMLILIVALFAACWFPIHLMNLLIYFVPAIYQFDTKFGYTLFIAFYLGSHFLSMAHGLVNPLIYLNSGLKFRFNLGHLMGQCLRNLKRCDRQANNNNNNQDEPIELSTKQPEAGTLTSFNSHAPRTTKVTLVQSEINNNNETLKTSSLPRQTAQPTQLLATQMLSPRNIP